MTTNPKNMNHHEWHTEAVEALAEVFDSYDLDDIQMLATLSTVVCTLMAASNVSSQEATLLFRNMEKYYLEYSDGLKKSFEK